MIHFKRSDSDIYDSSNSSASAGHALIRRILFKRRREDANGEPFAVLGSRQPHYIHIRTSRAYTHYLGAEFDAPARARTTSNVSALVEDSASEYSCDSAQTDDRPSQNIDFTVIWDPETGFSVYGSDTGNHPVANPPVPPGTLHPQANHLPEMANLQKKPLPRMPSRISEECQGLVSQFPGETYSEKESFYGASDDSGHPDCEPHLPSRFSMTTTCSFLQPNEKATRPSGRACKHDILHRLRQHSHSYQDVPSFLQPQKRDNLMRSKASIRQFSSHFPTIKRRVTDISEEHWVLLEVFPRVSEQLVSSD